MTGASLEVARTKARRSIAPKSSMRATGGSGLQSVGLSVMDPFFLWLEETPISIWIRESTSIVAFPGILSAHAIGMALAAGINAAIALHVLGVAAGIPPREWRRFIHVMWFGFWLNAASGVLLVIAYPTKALTNPVFYLKLTLIVVAMGLSVSIRRRLLRFSREGLDGTAARGRRGGALRFAAAAALVCWAGAIASGRLLAYTYNRLMATW